MAFLERFGSEREFARALFATHWPHGLQCSACGYHEHCSLRTRKVLQCTRCKHQTCTADTVLANTSCHRALGTWLLKHKLMQTMRERDDSSPLTPSWPTPSCHRALGTWLLKHKLMQTMRERDDSRPLAGNVELDEAYRGGERARGRAHEPLRGDGPSERKGPPAKAADDAGAWLPQARDRVLGAPARAARHGRAQ